MNPKKKRLYIILGIVCAVLAAGVLIWSNSYSPDSEPLTPVTNSGANNTAPVVTRTATGDATYSPPAVFPQNTNFDSSIMGQLKVFQNFQPSQLVEGEQGRPNPFTNY